MKFQIFAPSVKWYEGSAEYIKVMELYDATRNINSMEVVYAATRDIKVMKLV